MRSSLLALATALGLLACQRESPHHGITWREVESPANIGAQSPRLHSGADGVVHMSWLEVNGETAKLLASAWKGGEWAEPTEVARGNNWFVNWADVPQIAALADGTLMATWLAKAGPATFAYHVMFALSHDGGASWSAGRRLHDDDSPTEHGFVSLAALSETEFAAVWLDGHATDGGGSMALHARTIGSDGKLGAEVELDPRVCDCCPTSLAPLPDDDEHSLIAVYRDRFEDEVRDIALVALGPEGWTAPKLVQVDGWKVPGCPVNGPSVTGSSRVNPTLVVGFRGGDDPMVWLSECNAPASLEFFWQLRVDEGAPEGRAQVVDLDDAGSLILWLENEVMSAAWMARGYSSQHGLGEPTSLVDVPPGRATGDAQIATLPGTNDALFAFTDPDEETVGTRLLTVDY